MSLLIDWVSGVDLQELADRHLGAVASDDYRYEQLAEFVASVFEHFLPWALGTLVDWVNTTRLRYSQRPSRSQMDSLQRFTMESARGTH